MLLNVTNEPRSAAKKSELCRDWLTIRADGELDGESTHA
jgi:hypothetical protein